MEISEEATEREAEPILDGVTVREFGFGKCSNNVYIHLSVFECSHPITVVRRTVGGLNST